MENKNIKNTINTYIRETEREIKILEKEILYIIYQYSTINEITPEDAKRIESVRVKIMEYKDILDDLNDKKDKYNTFINTPYGMQYKTHKDLYTFLKGINNRGTSSGRVFIINDAGKYIDSYMGGFIDDLAVEIIKEYEEKEI